MTNEEFIRKAIEYLETHNKVAEDKLEKPLIHDAKVIYFKIRFGLYVMMTLDSQTGERLDTHFGPNPFLKQGPPEVS